MLNIYILENISKKDNRELLSSLPAFLQTQISKYTNPEIINKKASSYYLLFNKLNELLGIKEDSFTYKLQGKPYLKNHPNIFFNISHSKNTIAVAISTSEVGVDVMDYLDPIDGVVSYAFHQNEKDALNNSVDKRKEFTKIWSNKEAYLKYEGKGISSQMKELDTTKLSIPTKFFDKYLVCYYSKETSAQFVVVDNIK